MAPRSEPECVEVNDVGEKMNMKNELRCNSWPIKYEVDLALLKKEQFQRDHIEIEHFIMDKAEKWDEITKQFHAEGKMYSKDQIIKKWNNIMSDFKKIFNYQAKSGAEDWWNMTSNVEKKACGLNLLRLGFTEELFIIVASFNGERPAVTGEHVVETGVAKENEKVAESFSTKKKRKKEEKEEKTTEADKVKPHSLYQCNAL